MGFAKGKETTEFKNELKVGVIPYTLKSVCPNLDELKAIYGENAKEIIYRNKPQEPQVMVVFIFEEYDSKANTGTKNLVRHYHFLKFEPSQNKDGSKKEVINKYGDNAWVTVDEFNSGSAPSYMKDYILPYKQAVVGESTLIKFVKDYIGIPGVNKYENGGWVRKDDLTGCEASFTKEQLQAMIKGDFTYLKTILGYQPDNKIKFYTGVRTTENGQFTTLLFESPIKYAASKYAQAVKQAKYVMENNDEIYFPENTTPHIFSNETSTTPDTGQYPNIPTNNPAIPAINSADYSGGVNMMDDLPF